MISNTIRNRVIAVSTDNHGISYSDDNGHTFTLSNITTGSFDKAIYNNNGIAVTRAIDKGNNNSVEGILYSEDGGATWIAAIEDGFFSPIVKLNNGMMYSSHLETGKTYYSEDGKKWLESSALVGEYLMTQWDIERDWEQTLAAYKDTGRNLQTVFGCSTLQETCQLLQEKSNNKDYSGLMPCGDYIELSKVELFNTDGTSAGLYTANDETQTLRFVVAGLGIYNDVGYKDSNDPNGSQPGIVFIEKNVLCQARMHSSTSSLPVCPQTELGLKLGSAGTIQSMETELGVSLKGVRRYYDGAWLEEKIFLPNEREVFLDTTYAADKRSYNTSIIWPIFSKCPQSRIKYHQSNVGERRWWWTANKSSASGYYTSVDNYGNAIGASATGASGSVVLAFSL